MIWKPIRNQEFLVRYFVIFKNFAEAELKMFSHHSKGLGAKERELFLPVSESSCKLLISLDQLHELRWNLS